MISPAETVPDARPVARRLRPSALRRSALQRVSIAALPVALLWLAVAFALDFWR